MIQRALAIERLHYDVVHVHDIFAALAGFTVANVLGLPTVFTKHFCLPGRRTRPQAGDTLRYFMSLEDWSFQTADHLIAVSSHVQRIIIGRDDRFREKCSLVTSGTNIGAARTSPDRPASRERLTARLGTNRPLGYVLLQVGRLVYVKAADVSVHALAALMRDAPVCDPHLVLIGTGTPRSEYYLRDLASQLGVADRLHFGGPEHSRDTLADLYKAADVIIVPSRSESFPLVVAEATTLRRLVVAADVGGIGEQIAHMRNGLLFRHGSDPVTSGRSLAELVKWAVANPAAAARIAEFGPLHGRNTYSWLKMASKTLSIYRDVTGRTTRKTGAGMFT
jgi:D-inositol-3-phosphate glycosyltransferase